MPAKIAAKTLERWPEACSNHARLDKLLHQGAPFNYRQENAPVKVRRTNLGDDSGAFLASFHSRLQALHRNAAAYLCTPTPGTRAELMLRNPQCGANCLTSGSVGSSRVNAATKAIA